MAGDILALEGHAKAGEPLLQGAMQDGRRSQPAESLDAIRARVKRELERLPEPLRKLETRTIYPVGACREPGRADPEFERPNQPKPMSRARTSATMTSSSWWTCRTTSAPAA